MLSNEVADKVADTALGHFVEEVLNRVIERASDEVSARLAQEPPLLEICCRVA